MDLDYIDYLANLSKFKLNGVEKQWIHKYITEAISSAEILDEIDIDSKIKDSTSEKVATLRKDEVKEFSNVERFFENAPSRENNYFKIDSK